MLHIRLHCGHVFGDRIAQRDLLLSGQEQRTQMEGPQTPKWMCQRDLEPNTAAFVHPKKAPLSLSLLGEPCKRGPRFSFLSVSRIRQKGTPPKKKTKTGQLKKKQKGGNAKKEEDAPPSNRLIPTCFFGFVPRRRWSQSASWPQMATAPRRGASARRRSRASRRSSSRGGFSCGS